MKLIDDFYKIVLLEKNNDSFSCKVSLNANHGLYRVHFPGNPVTPGVCLIQMASEILEQEYKYKLLLSSAGSIKFMKPVGPNDNPTFIFSKVVKEDGHLKANVSVEDVDQYVKMALVFSILENEQ